MTKAEVEALSEAWLSRWGGSPIAHELRGRHTDRWVRFHSLPESKRYAQTEEEYGVILDRHHTVLLQGVTDDELGCVIIAPRDLRWLYHPHDGGADVIAPTTRERDALKIRHRDWLSAHPAGL